MGGRRLSRPRPAIGILGGTFDPPHIGHLWLATLAADALDLDRVLLMPAANPPHKRAAPVTDAAIRLELTEAAVQGDDRLGVSVIEMERPGPSYTVDSLAQLARTHPGARLVLLLATDQLAQIDTWHEPDRLLAQAEWAVAERAGWPFPAASALEARFGGAADRIHRLEGPALDLSSTLIRGRVAAGGSIRYLVPRAVEDLITAHGLYRSMPRPA